MRLSLVLLTALLVAGPAAAQEGAGTEAPAVPAVTASDAPRRARSLYADLRAFQTGDLVTVVLAERTSARRASASQASATASTSGAASLPGGRVFGADAQVNGARASDSQTAQSDALTGTLAARVVSVDPAGNLTIEGERRLNVDGATHLLRVRGTVRPADISRDNAVLSYQIAGADVEYRQEGRRLMRPRLLTTVGLVAVVVAAVVVGTSAATAAAAP